MIRAQRIEVIKKLGTTRDIITWSELQKILNVSKSTAQRDAEILSDAHVLTKTRGGIVFTHNIPDSGELTIQERENANITEKKRIAKAALPFIKQNSFVMFDSGSTVLELIRFLPDDTTLTAITYSIQSAIALSAIPNIDVYLSGGKIRNGFMSCHGVFAENVLNQFHADVCFLGADSVSAAGISGHNMYDIKLKQIMIQSSNKVILLADSSKFRKSASMFVADFQDIDILITDKNAPENECQNLKKKGVDVIIV